MTTYLPWLAIGVGVVLLVAQRLWIVFEPKNRGSNTIKITASGVLTKDQVRAAFDLLYDAFPALRETLDKVAPIIWKYRVPPQPTG
jgi:hypothetical protein